MTVVVGCYALGLHTGGNLGAQCTGQLTGATASFKTQGLFAIYPGPNRIIFATMSAGTGPDPATSRRPTPTRTRRSTRSARRRWRRRSRPSTCSGSTRSPSTTEAHCTDSGGDATSTIPYVGGVIQTSNRHLNGATYLVETHPSRPSGAISGQPQFRWRWNALSTLPLELTQSEGLNQNPLNLVERHLLGAPIVKLRRARRGMVRHLRGLFKRAAILQVGSDARRAEGVVADARADPAALARRWIIA